MMKIAFRLDLPHGRCVGVVVPERLPTVPEIPEREIALALREGRRPGFVAGRVALRAALEDLGVAAGALTIGDRGAPVLPAAAVGSISHKRTLAVGLAARADGQQIGVDVENDAPLRIDVSGRVLTDEESHELAGRSADDRRRGLLQRLSMKESIYKALDPFVRRYVSFKEATVIEDREGGWIADLALAKGEGPFSVEVSCRLIWADDPFFLTTAAIRRA
jgi:4'-phosphopantetheinyl transferase EntD